MNFNKNTIITATLVTATVLCGLFILNGQSELNQIRSSMARNDHNLVQFTQDYERLKNDRQLLIEEAEKIAVEMTTIEDQARATRQNNVELQTRINALIKGEDMSKLTINTEGKE